MIDIKHQTLLELMSDAIIIVDNDGVIVFVNNRTERMFGYAKQELVGEKIEILIPDNIKDEHVGHRSSFVKNPQARSMEEQKSLVGRNKSGSLVPVEISLSPLNSDNTPYTIASIRDVTKRRLIEKELRRSHEVLEKRVAERTADLQAANNKLTNEMDQRKKIEERARQQQADITHVSRLSLLGEMSSGLAHELNQPLAAISNYSQGCIRRIQSNTAETASLVQAMERITSEANRASDIITRLRRFVRKEELQHTCLALNSVVQDVMELVDFEFKNHGISVQSHLAKNLPEICIDTIQIQQVLVNLIWNAIEAMGDNPEHNRKLNIDTALAEDDTVEITVCDNGYGISEDVEKQLFNQFFTTKEHGLGIGLSISRNIIEDHGGKIWSEQNPEGGSIFKLSLPIVKTQHD